MNGAGSFHELLGDLIHKKLVRVNLSRNKIEFKNGSTIHLCHCQHEKDVYNYQGAEIHLLGLDELTHFTDFIYKFLRSRVRLGGLKVPEEYRELFPRIIAGSNPGNIGHQWVKETFIDPKPPMEKWRTEPQDGGMYRQYIPAHLTDNPTLLENDPLYRQRLEGLGSPELVRAMLEGDWDIVAGAAFEKLHRQTHSVRPFKIPEHWTRFMSMDWGTAKPFSVGWYAVAEAGS